MSGLWFGYQTVMMLDGCDNGGGVMLWPEWREPPGKPEWQERLEEDGYRRDVDGEWWRVSPDDDELMYQYDNEVAEESWS